MIMIITLNKYIKQKMRKQKSILRLSIQALNKFVSLTLKKSVY